MKEVDKVLTSIDRLRSWLVGAALLVVFLIYLMSQQASEIRVLRTQVINLKTAAKEHAAAIERLEKHHEKGPVPSP